MNCTFSKKNKQNDICVGGIKIRNSRLRPFKNKNKRLLLIAQIVAIWYIVIIAGSYLTSNTGAYLNDSDKVTGKITVGTWEKDDKEGIEEDQSLRENNEEQSSYEKDDAPKEDKKEEVTTEPEKEQLDQPNNNSIEEGKEISNEDTNEKQNSSDSSSDVKDDKPTTEPNDDGDTNSKKDGD
ncbi:SipW-dependent-type signal peptide-containing protein [Heyndrickxia sp. NPDC080065]|uniref:SipW-dependent-type signal peptide-containing protein n=1 Tax=Heyndrickxia sp. NPDC080065 TaxID=3390568 RepID=UPI003D07A03A